MGIEDLKGIKEVRSCSTDQAANKLLGKSNWRLIEVKVEKVSVPRGVEKVGINFVPEGFFHSGGKFDQMEVTYEEKLVPLYILGRY